jgi:hypothetical protein
MVVVALTFLKQVHRQEIKKMISVHNEYGQIISDIFNKYENDLYFTDFNKKPFYNDRLENNDLLFIGLTPSLNEKDLDKDFFTLDQKDNLNTYYKKFEEISSKFNVCWDYLDLLFIRETKQERIEQLITSGLSFIWDQLQISKQILVSTRPKVVVVCNTLARRFLGKDKNKINKTEKWLEFTFKFDSVIGTDRFVELNNVPVFFTSMLTGQRALDKGSFERLLWHLEFVLNKG